MVEDDSPRVAPAPAIDPATAKSRLDRAMAAIRALNLDDALAILADVEETLRFSRDPGLRVEWARCLNGLGFIELMDAKETRRNAGSGADEQVLREFQRALRHALARFDQALAIQSDETYRKFVLGNKAYALALLGRTDDARATLVSLFASDDRALYEGQIVDTQVLRVPEDEGVSRLLQEVWQDRAVYNAQSDDDG